MKYAGGCFGCLTLILLATTMFLSFGSGIIASALTEVDPSLAATFGGMVGLFSQISGSCCCLSGVLAVILLAIGFSSGGKAEEAT